MKIGILTWFFGANYGAKAHTFALQKYLSGLGADVEIIQYVPAGAKKINIRMNVKKPYYRYAGSFVNGIRRCIRFEKFNAAFSLSPRVYTAAQIDNLKYDLIILGSDEVLNLAHPLKDPVYYGVGITQTPCMLYAPSMGQMPDQLELGKNRRDSLSGMQFLSARDEYTQKKLAENTQKDVKLACDPTFLYHFGSECRPLNLDPYLLIYSFEDLSQYRAQIIRYARAHGLCIAVVGQKLQWADRSYPAVDEAHWLGAFQKAALVITDSFHGTVFSIKNRIEYVVVSRADKTNKIDGLHRYLDIRKEFYDGRNSIEAYLGRNKLDYEKVQAKVDARIKESQLYLQEAMLQFKKKSR